MKKIDWVRKLTSRKLWTAVASFVSMMILATGGTDNTATQVTALIMAEHQERGGEFGEEIDTVDLEMADGKKITAPAVVDVSALGCMDELEYELWHVIEDYMLSFGIRTIDDEPDWATVKAVQDCILNQFIGAGVNFKLFDDETQAEINKRFREKENEANGK